MQQQLPQRNVLEEFLIMWNVRYPYDRFFRKKYNIPFGSSEHKKMNFMDMAMDIKEDILFSSPKAKKQADNEEHDEFVAQTGLEFEAGENQEQPLTQVEIDYAYNNLNLADYNDK